MWTLTLTSAFPPLLLHWHTAACSCPCRASAHDPRRSSRRISLREGSCVRVGCRCRGRGGTGRGLLLLVVVEVVVVGCVC